MGQLGKTMANTGKAMLWYAQTLLKDVDAKDFARKPTGPAGEIDANHPAFIFGHLAVYPPWLLEAMEVETGPAIPESYSELFGHTADCHADPDRTRYPDKDEIVTAFFDGYRHLLSVLESIDDEVFARPLKHENLRDFFPTVGDLVDFMVGAHAMGHLGQLSTWRRCMGLGSAMKAGDV